MIPEKILSVNQRLEITVEKGDKVERYSSRIEDITDNKLTLAMPIVKGFPIFLLPGTGFYGKIIYNQNVFLFKANYIDKRLHPLPVWITTIPTTFKKIQQRSFVRVSTFIDCDIEIIEKKAELETVHNIKTFTRDISGGGAQISLREPIAVGTVLSMSFMIPEGLLKLQCQVIRSELQAETEVFWVGLKFLEINEQDRSKLIRHIYQLQLHQRRKK